MNALQKGMTGIALTMGLYAQGPQWPPTRKDVVATVHKYMMEEFEVDPRITAQRLLTYQGIPMASIPGDMYQGFIRHASKELREGANPNCMDRAAINAWRWGQMSISPIDPSSVISNVESFDKDKLYTFDAISKEMYWRLRWMKKGPHCITDCKNDEKVRREDAILKAWEAQVYRANRARYSPQK
jgi:hypothetical protein